MMKRLLPAFAICLLLLRPSASFAQAPASTGKLIVTVTDSQAGVLPNADVTVVALDDATKAAAIAPLKTNEKGVVTFENLKPGHYSIEGVFPGFDPQKLKDVQIKPGDNKHLLILALAGKQDTVTVQTDKLSVATDRTATFGTTLTREQIDALSDDPDEMQQQLMNLAGPNAQIMVDSFNGAPLPPKSQIKSIHISRDQYAAEQHYAGGISIEIVTQPGAGPLHASTSSNFRDSALNAQNPFTSTKAPERIQRYYGSASGSLIPNKMGFSLNASGSASFINPTATIVSPAGVPETTVLGIRQPSDSYSYGGTLDDALTKDHVLRFFVNGSHNESKNLGIGAFNEADEAYSRASDSVFVRLLETGPLRRRMFISTKGYYSFSQNASVSATEAPTVTVLDAFSTGGAQQAGGTHTNSFELASDLDYVRGINSFRTGVLLDGSAYNSNARSNYLGTYTFADLAAYQAGMPSAYTQRVGNPNVSYWNAQLGLYLQDDIHVSKKLSLSPGVRYEVQEHVPDHNNIMPRVGLTWAPFKSGVTSIRASWGLFHDWMSPGTYQQTIQVDGAANGQQDISIVNPTYPVPNVGSAAAPPPTSKYLLGPGLQLPTTDRVSVGFDQALTKQIHMYMTYSYSRGSNIFRGDNLNAPVNGVAPDPTFANIIEVVSDAANRYQDLSLSFNGSLPANPANRTKRFDWKRLSINGYVDFSRQLNDSDGAFAILPSNDLSTEWGPVPGSTTKYASIGIYSTQLRNFSASTNLFATNGPAYNITTGFDNNGDTFFNDRPIGVSRDSARGPGQWALSARFSYALGLGKRPLPAGGGVGPTIMMPGGGMIMMGGGPTGDTSRYHLNFSVSISNLTNHENLIGVSGVMTSPYFGIPSNAGPMRKIDFSVGLSF